MRYMTKIKKLSSATAARVLDALSSVKGHTASSVANQVGLSPSTARQHLADLRKHKVARRDDESGEWFVVLEPTTEPLAKPARKDVPEGTKDDELEATLAASLEGVEGTTNWTDYLVSIGFSRRTATLDGSLVNLLRDLGPLSREQVAEKLTLPTWSFRRMTEGKHGDLRFDPLVEVTGRGQDRKYRARV